MKKLTKTLTLAIISFTIFTSCEKEDEPVVVAKISYDKDIKPIFVTNCAPCHLAGGANPNKWDQFDVAKSKITSILDRVQREPGTTGFMPRNGTMKLSAENITKLKQWVTDGLLEK
jgi:Cytochrome C oxidase, cbb3-type, subunit III